MCTYQTLSYNDQHGYILYCRQCQYIQFGFGCVLINFVKSEFQGFRKVIEEIVLDYDGLPESNFKSITIPTPCEGLLLYLSIKELRVLYSMNEEAETNLRANELLELFSAPM